MIFHLYHRSEPKISTLCCKFVPSLPLLKNPANICEQNVNRVDNFNPLSVLKDPNKSRNLSLGDAKIVHGRLLRASVTYLDIFDANNLLNCYSRCGNVSYAFNLFEKIPEPNIVSWNSMLSGCNKNLLYEKSWRVFCKMHGLDLVMNEYTYGSVLAACGALECVMWGEQVYGLSMKNGFFSNAYVRTGMIDLYSVSCRFDDALKVFHDVSCVNVASWTTIISGAVKNKEYWVALNIFKSMCSRFMVPTGFTLSCVLTACAAVKDLEFGRGVQGWMIKCGLKEDIVLCTSVLDFYAKSGDMDNAAQQFWLIPFHNVVSWTAMISGFAKNGDFVSAVQYFNKMITLEEEINNYTVTSVLMACANPGAVREAIQIHCWILKTGSYSDLVVKASLINMYSKVGAVDSSEIVFQESDSMKHLGTCATMISAYTQTKYCERAIYLFRKMLQMDLRPEKFCTSSVLGITESLTIGRQIHSYIVKIGLLYNVSVGSSLSAMYSKCGSLEESYYVFSLLEGRDTVSWASMIAGFVKNESPSEAINCFREMLSEEIAPDEINLSALLSAYATLSLLKAGKEVHGFSLRNFIRRKTSIDVALVNMYLKCGFLDTARRVFDMMPVKNPIAYSALVSGYIKSGHIEESLQLFNGMLIEDVDTDAFTISSILGSLANLGMPRLGSQVHGHAIKVGLESEVSVGSSLLMLYSKIGSINDCDKVFEQIETPDVISWTALIASYAQHGKASEALQIYELMKRSESSPDWVTFIAVLSSCSHGGLIEEGYFHFNSMKIDYGIQPNYRHYSCMVDLLGRAGRLKEAERFILDMPIRPNALVWGTLLAACKVHGDVDLGKVAAEKVRELEPLEAGTFVSLANICADVGQWEEVLNLRNAMVGTGVRKEAGWSSV